MLGMPIGDNSGKLSFWNLVISHIRDKLSSWKFGNLSVGDRFILFKVVLTSFMVYIISFL